MRGLGQEGYGCVRSGKLWIGQARKVMYRSGEVGYGMSGPGKEGYGNSRPG